MGQVSTLEGPSPDASLDEPNQWVSYEDEATGYLPVDWRDQPEVVQRAEEARLRQLAAAGDIEAACALGVRLQGRSRPEDGAQRRIEAEQWFRLAAERGHGWAAFHLALLLVERGEEEEEAAYRDERAQARGIGSSKRAPGQNG